METLLTSKQELLRNGTSDNLFFKTVAFEIALGLHEACHTRVITRTTSLFLEKMVEVDMFGDGFSVSDTRWAGFALDLVFSPHTFNVDLKVEFTHTRDDGLLTLGVEMYPKCRILTLEPSDGFGEVLQVLVVLGLDTERDDRIRHVHAGHAVAQLTVGKGVAGCTVNSEDGTDLSGANFRDFLHFVGVHSHHTGDFD